MRIALISDIHGNLIALRAVLADIERRGTDRIVCLGDVANLGAAPIETLDTLRRLGCDYLKGNHDAYILNRDLHVQYGDPAPLLEATDWCREQLSETDLAFLDSFRPSLSIDLGASTELFLYHGTPRSNAEDLTATTPPEQVDEMLGGRRAAVCAGGHTHVQMLRQHRGMLIVNAGSVGAPFREVANGEPPVVLHHAEYATIEASAGRIEVGLHRVPLDTEELRKSAMTCPEPLRTILLGHYGG